MPLNSPAVNGLSVVESTQGLWFEWLSGYFDGGTHTLGGSGVAFPSAHLAFDQSDALPQPLSGVGISVVAASRGGRDYLDDDPTLGKGKLAFDEITWTFYVRAQVADTGAGNSAYQCRRAADLLNGLLRNSAATIALHAKGITDLKARAPQVVSDGLFALRVVTVRGRLQYSITF